MTIAENKKFFHWFLEFPEIFGQEGFDCILGNPPFLGGYKLSGNYGTNFLEYLKYTYRPIGAVDLVTYFFRRIFDIIKINGFQSLISTKTIAQGYTREGGLDVICSSNGVINHAVRSRKWPGKAAVEVSLVTIHKGEWKKQFILNDKSVEQITPYLDDSENSEKPKPLLFNKGKCFKGNALAGKGFLLTPKEALALIDKDPRNKEVLFPCLGGRDFVTSPTQEPSRWVINFSNWSEEKARSYPDCFDIVERLVKPERQRWKKDNQGNELVGTYALRKPLPQKWWTFRDNNPALNNAISDLDQVMIVGKTTKYSLTSIYKNNIVFSASTTVFTFRTFSEFAILNSSFHDAWIYKNGTTKGESGLHYCIDRAFMTFPFPTVYSEELNGLGNELHITRSKIMKRYQLGLTNLYNIFHDIQLNSKVEIYDDIIQLRELHKRIDSEIIKLYNWNDIDLKYGFYELEHLNGNDRTRFAIQPSARKEILKRLLLLNLERSKSEALVKKRFKSTAKASTISLFPED